MTVTFIAELAFLEEKMESIEILMTMHDMQESDTETDKITKWLVCFLLQEIAFI